MKNLLPIALASLALAGVAKADPVDLSNYAGMSRSLLKMEERRCSP